MNGVQVHRVGFDSLKEVAYYYSGSAAGRGRVGVGVQRPGTGMRLLSWLYNLIWKKIYFPDDACLWFFPARRKALALLDSQDFDAVITVSLPFTGHLIGLSVKRHFPILHWLADIGDPFTIQARPLNNPYLYKRLSRKLERSVLERADAVVVTNTGAKRACERVFGTDSEKIRVISPLLHPAVLPEQGISTDKPIASAFLHAPARTLHVGYFGALYAPVRMPDAFLDVLEKTFAARPDLKGRLQVHFFGDVFPEFYDKLNRQCAIHLYGLRSRQEVRAAMHQMDILINIGNITDYQLPSKAVDYLAAGKPVLHLSYLDEDPFVQFWGDWPGLLSLVVENNCVSEESIDAWLGFLLARHPAVPTEAIAVRTRPFRIAAIAEAYASICGLPPLLPSISDIAAIPVHR